MHGSELAKTGVFTVATLLGRSKLEKISEILAQIYGVHDLRVSAAYLERAEALGYSTSQLIDAMLQIAPLEHQLGGSLNAGEAHGGTEILPDLLARADTIRHKAIKLACEKAETSAEPFSAGGGQRPASSAQACLLPSRLPGSTALPVFLSRIFVPPPAPSPEQAGRYSVAA